MTFSVQVQFTSWKGKTSDGVTEADSFWHGTKQFCHIEIVLQLAYLDFPFRINYFKLVWQFFCELTSLLLHGVR